MSVSNIRLGQCSVSYNSVAIGHTKGGIEMSIKNDVTEVTVDKYGITPAKAYHKGTRIEVTMQLSEYDFTQMEQVINAATKVMSTLEIGKKAGTQLTGAQLVLTPLEAASTELDITLYNAVIIGDTKIPFKVDQETVYQVTFLALVSEDDADENGQGFLAKLGNEN